MFTYFFLGSFGSKESCWCRIKVKGIRGVEVKVKFSFGQFLKYFLRAQCKIQFPLCRTFQCNFRQDLQVLTITRNLQTFGTLKYVFEFSPHIVFEEDGVNICLTLHLNMFLILYLIFTTKMTQWCFWIFTPNNTWMILEEVLNIHHK